MGTAMRIIMRSARAEDSNLLEKHIIGYLPFDENPACVSPLFPFLNSGVHIFRRFMKFVREGKDGYKMKANDLPSFLYPHGTVHDVNNPDSGLFRGHVLIRVRYFKMQKTSKDGRCGNRNPGKTFLTFPSLHS